MTRRRGNRRGINADISQQSVMLEIISILEITCVVMF